MTGATTGMVKAMLRLEGLCVLVVSAFVYPKFGAGWGIFAACFLLPDLSLIGYVVGPRVGACAYNVAHSYIGPVACMAVSLVFPSSVLTTAYLIWLAHIGFDRALGYGLKYAEGFRYTHLGLIGRAAGTMPNTALDADTQARRSI